jgi:phage gpG-like protein
MSIRWKVQGDGLLPLNTRWWTPTRKEWAPVLQDSQSEYWQQQTNSFNGQPWKPLTEKYAAKKSILYPGAPILRATGAMQDTMTIQSTPKKFHVHGVDYGKYHQFGTKRMSARPWVGFPEQTLGPLTELAWKNILSRKRYSRRYKI